MLAQDVENTGQAKPNTYLGQIPPTGGVLRPWFHTDTHTQVDTHTFTDMHINIQIDTGTHNHMGTKKQAY